MITSRLTVASLAAMLALTACTGNDGSGSLTEAGSSSQASQQSEASQPPAQTAPAGMTPEAYQADLDTAGKPVGAALSAIAKARTFKSLDQRLQQAQDAVDGAVDRLGDLQAPAETVAEHAGYVEALRSMDDELVTLHDAISDQSLCTSSAVLARLGRSDEFTGLKEAGAALADKGDYGSAAIGLKPPKERSRRLSSGTVLTSRIRGGRGSLTVKNGGSQDGVVTLLKGKQKAVSVYVRKKSSAKVSNIKDGSYRVYFTTGVDYDRTARAFTRNCTFQRFDDSLPFRTTYTATQIRWSVWTITLNRVKGGNARSSAVNPDDFPT
ncbi:hypothetical protein [Planotetraspora kaengkrachanensis]|uniref:DUF4349 domain-containing protein n=1 Tax=Planotetraspora kaengkrachanensis TaxID=575193 RepID=A0A8J3Q026_9ACTN|nr:hypothetical protein [Planotetraspora kaengkrachanensis]GIG84018.1 hypothetical protein Pka01_71450 [Planotetraspora kaengkrachanensis]